MHVKLDIELNVLLWNALNSEYWLFFFIVFKTVPPAQTPDSTSMLVAAKVEIMDFSMPSYGDAYGGDTASGSKQASGIPSFNPFGSSEPETPAEAEDTSAADAKAAAEAKKAEEKAAAEAKKAEEEAKRAEKEARRQAELEKQKEAVERAKQKKAEEAAAAAVSVVVVLCVLFSSRVLSHFCICYVDIGRQGRGCPCSTGNFHSFLLGS